MDDRTDGKYEPRMRTARLWRVLVLGGAVLAAACGSPSKEAGPRNGASSAKDQQEGKGERGDRGAGGDSGGGVASW